MKKPSTGYKVLKAVINFLLSILVKIKVTGYENFDKNQQYVVVSNHTSWLDLIILIAKTPKTFQLVSLAERAGAYQQKLIKFFIEKGDLKLVEIDRTSQTSRMTGLRQIIKSANEGYPVVILPEGRINRDGNKLYPFYTGVFFAAVKTGLPILPVYIRGTSKVYFRRRVTVNFGVPLQVEKNENVEDVAIKTYHHMLDNVKPEEPKNRSRKVKYDLTKAFLGDYEYPPEEPGKILADGRDAANIFSEANEDSIERYMKNEENI